MYGRRAGGRGGLRRRARPAGDRDGNGDIARVRWLIDLAPGGAALVQSCDAIVIGAGPAGLATATALRARGLNATLLEKFDAVGAVWRRHYDRLHLHTDRARSGSPWHADNDRLRPLSFARAGRRVSRGLRSKVRSETGLQRPCSRGAARWARLARRRGQELANRTHRRCRDRLGRLSLCAHMAGHGDLRRPDPAFERLSQSSSFHRQTHASRRLWQFRR